MHTGTHTYKPSEERVREANEIAEDVRRGEEELSWVVRREEIHLTDEELGRGGYAVVRVAKFRGLRVAAKCLHQQIFTDYNHQIFTREMIIIASIHHPNIVQFLGATIHGELIILTELMTTSLRDILAQRRVTSSQCLSISLDIAAALNYLHLLEPDPIVHRDISSANILLEPTPNDSWRAKLCDFNSANFSRQLRTANPGSPVYTAPEASDPSHQSTKMDIFSFGVLLVEVYSARFPVPSDREDLIQSIRDGRVVKLIRQCTSKDRTRRPTASDVITQLQSIMHSTQGKCDYYPGEQCMIPPIIWRVKFIVFAVCLVPLRIYVNIDSIYWYLRKVYSIYDVIRYVTDTYVQVALLTLLLQMLCCNHCITSCMPMYMHLVFIWQC